ncbi:MAG TPA: hypothetical protein VGQ69_08300 [Gemmatimonadales bacterium]|nr:hypothetical protein [Gemmatimonadales bacterium]
MRTFLRVWAPATALVLVAASGAAAQSFATVEVTGMDYAFRAPATLPPGLTAFSFKNEGKVPHEVVIVRLKPGVVLDSLLKADNPTRRTMIQLAGILVATPGEAPLGRLLVDLTEGTYLLLCNFRDAPDKPPHLNLGMVSVLQVK